MKKIISSLLSTIFVLGAIPLTSSSCSTHEQLKTVENDLSNKKSFTNIETFTTDYSVVSSLKTSGKISKQKAKNLMDQVITNEYVETRVSDIVDKIAAEINTFGKLSNWSEDKIQSTVLDKCGTFLANYNAKKDEIISNDDYANNELLDYINKQASALNIDVFDYYQSANAIKSIESNFSLQLSRVANLTSSEKIEKITAFNSIYDTFLKFAKSRFLSSLEFNWEILNLSNTQDYYTNFVQPLASNYYSSYQDFHESATEKQLFILAQLFSDYLKNGNLSLINDGSNFIHHIEQYSSDGYLSNDNPCIHTEDLTELFSFTYDNLQGTILSLPNFDYLVPTQQGDLVDDIGLITSAPISKYTTKEGSTYELGELYPGYKAHFRVSAIDYSSDESKCNLNLEIGVSDSIRDPKDEHILWTTEYLKQVDDDRVDPANGVLKYSLSVKEINNRRYIASHYFYNNWTTAVAGSKYDKKLDEYFTDTASQRPYLDELLDRNAAIENDEYVISEQSPMYLTADDVKGIPLPNVLLKNPTSNFPTFDTPVHTSQYLRFMVTDYSTEVAGEHKLSLYGSWAVISTTASTNDENSRLINQSYVYKLPWKINNSNGGSDTQEGLWVSYEIDQELQEAMEIAEKYGKFLEGYMEIEPTVLNLDKPANSKNSVTPMESADKTYSFLAAEIGLDVVLAASIIVAAVICYFEEMSKPWKAAFLALYVVCFLLLSVKIIIESIWFDIFNNARKTIENNILPVTKKWTGTVHQVSDDVIENYNKLQNRRLTFAKREEITDQILFDFGLDRQGNVVNSDKVGTIKSWVKELYDAYDKKFSEKVKKLTDDNFIYFWKKTPDINQAKDAIEATFTLTVFNILGTTSIITTYVAGSLKALASGATGALGVNVAQSVENAAMGLTQDNPLFSLGTNKDPYNTTNDVATGDSHTMPYQIVGGSLNTFMIINLIVVIIGFIDEIFSYIQILIKH